MTTQENKFYAIFNNEKDPDLYGFTCEAHKLERLQEANDSTPNDCYYSNYYHLELLGTDELREDEHCEICYDEQVDSMNYCKATVLINEDFTEYTLISEKV